MSAAPLFLHKIKLLRLGGLLLLLLLAHALELLVDLLWRLDSIGGVGLGAVWGRSAGCGRDG